VWRKQDEYKPSSPAPDLVVSPAPEAPARVNPPPVEPAAAGGNISKTISIRGEITGREDLFIDGEVQGTIRISDGQVTIGPNGRVTADIEAREIIVRGRVKGALHGRERVQIRSTGTAQGDVVTRRIAIEEGARLRGQVEVTRPEEAQVAKVTEMASGAAPARPVPVATKMS